MVDCVLGARGWWTEGIFYDGLCQVPGVGEQEGCGAAGAGQLLQQRAGQPQGAKDKGNNVVHMLANMWNESQIDGKYTRDAFRLFPIPRTGIVRLQCIFTQTEITSRIISVINLQGEIFLFCIKRRCGMLFFLKVKQGNITTKEPNLQKMYILLSRW